MQTQLTPFIEKFYASYVRVINGIRGVGLSGCFRHMEELNYKVS